MSRNFYILHKSNSNNYMQYFVIFAISFTYLKLNEIKLSSSRKYLLISFDMKYEIISMHAEMKLEMFIQY